MKTLPGSSSIWGSYLVPILIVLAVVGFRYWYFTPSAGAGKLAPDFEAVTLSGEDFKLTDYRGQPTLLHFWGSWCGPCRQQNPNLVDLAKATSGALQIVSIAIEKDRKRWEAAIEKDGLFWPAQIMDATTNLKFLNGPISDLYGVNQVPTEFLLDKDGRVVLTNPSPEQIRKFLKDAR
jgi:thiol-disulfide isomerase/thioredoxin